MNENLIAACGINCALCKNYLRKENKCPGCHYGRKVNGRPINCGIKLCKERQGKYCFDCNKFPCERLNRLDKRYQEKYNVSEIKNLEFIRDKGIDSFLKSQEDKYIANKKILCVHDKKYY